MLIYSKLGNCYNKDINSRHRDANLKMKGENKMKIFVSTLLLIICCSSVFATENTTTTPRRGPVYQMLPIGNFCNFGSYTVEYGSFSTSAQLDFSKTVTDFTVDTGTMGAYLYHYYDVNGKEYLPYRDGFTYQTDKTYYSNTCSGKVYR